MASHADVDSYGDIIVISLDISDVTFVVLILGLCGRPTRKVIADAPRINPVDKWRIEVPITVVTSMTDHGDDVSFPVAYFVDLVVI